MIRTLQYAFLAIVTISVGFSLYQWNASRAAVKLQQSSSVNLTNGLVGYWTFDGDDVSGTTAYDRSGSANNGTLTNGPTRTAGRIGQALNFDGVDDYVSSGSSAYNFTNSNFTISHWVKLNSLTTQTGGQGPVLIYKGTYQVNGYYVQVNTGGDIYFVTNQSSASQISSTASGSIVVGVWYFLTYVRNGTSVRIYINGVDSTTSAGTHTDPASSASALSIGKYTPSNIATNGSIDEPRIYNRALSAGEIQSLYDLGNPDKVNTPQGDPLEQGLVGYWKLDDASGTTATDSSGNANTGTLTNGPTWGTGRIGGDVVFDGTDDYVAIANSGALNFGTGNLSYAFWMKTTDVGALGEQILYKRGSGSGNPGFNIALLSGKIQAAFVDATSNAISDSTTSVNTGNWFHVALVYTRGASGILYINGLQEDSDSIAGVTGTISSSENMSLARNEFGGQFFNGSLDEVRIYNRALSDDEVTKLYRETTPDNPDTGLVGYWPMNGKDINGTTAYDRSGKGNTGTLTNGPTRTAGRIGQALNFDGTTQYVNLGNAVYNSFANNYSYSAWVKYASFSSDGAIVGHGSRSFMYVDSTGKPTLHNNISSTNYNWTANMTLSTNVWYHMVAVKSASSGVSIYINGTLISNFSGAPYTSNFDIYAGDYAAIGAYRYDGVRGQYMSGAIDEPRVYNRALSAGEILSLYDVGNPDKVNTPQGDPLEQGLVGYWKLDDASGTTATDSSGNANTGTLTNGPTWGTGRIGGDVVFDGTNDYINLGNSSILNFTNNFSISLWVNINNITQAGYKRFFGGDDINGSTRPVYLEYDYAANQYRAVWQNGGTYGSVAGKTLTAVGWQHFVVTFKDGVAKSYSDGALIGSSSSVVQPPSTAVNSYIGGTSGGGAFPGSIDEVRVYNRALSDEEVTKLYRETTPDNPDTGLVGYWPMNGKDIVGTTAYDRSGKGNTGTLTNGPTRTAGRIGQAINFDGTDDYVNYGNLFDFSGTAPYTISAWVNPNSANGMIVSKHNTGVTGQWRLSISSGALLTNRQVSPFGITGGSVPIGQWSHVLCIYNGATLSLYVNGVLVAGPTSFGSVSSDAVNVLIGANYISGSPSNFFNGKIDDVRIYNRALSATEITTLYNSGR